MRIAVDVTPIRPDGSAGGATGVAVELLKEIVKENKAEIILLCADWNKEYLYNIFENSVEYKEMITSQEQAKNNIIYRIVNKFIVRPLKKISSAGYDADLLFCPFSAVNFRQWNVPVVSTIHDIQHEFYPQFFAPEELQHRRNFYKNIVNKSERAICVSDYTRKTFCECYGYDEKKAITIYNAIQERFIIEDKNILKKLELENKQYIVFPANFWEHKNHKLLLNAFGVYAMKNPVGTLVLTGNALEQDDYYKQIIEAMKLKGRVIITGYLNEAELYSVLNNSRGLIYPSLFEGFGIPLVEAMQMNKLIASSNLTSLPEVGCDSIYYFDPKKADEIVKGIEFLFQSEMTLDIKEKYKQQLEKYSTATMMQQYLEVFDEVVASGAEEESSVSVEGIYGDGWTQKVVNFHMVKHHGDILKMSFRVPEHLNNKLKIFVKNGKKKRFSYVRNEKNEMLEIIDADSVDIQFILSTTWNPIKVMNIEDNRELGVLVEEIEIITREGIQKIDRE